MKKQLNFILLNGAMGSGKSTVASILEKKLKKTAIIEIEDIRKLVSPEDNELAWKVIYRMSDEYFKNGVSVLLKQTVASHDIVKHFFKLAKKYKAKINFYHFQAPSVELQKRISQRKKTRNVPKNLILSNIKKHQNIEYKDAAIVNTHQNKPNQIAKLILSNL